MQLVFSRTGAAFLSQQPPRHRPVVSRDQSTFRPTAGALTGQRYMSPAGTCDVDNGTQAASIMANAATRTDEATLLSKCTLGALPLANSKVLHFVRHAQGYHNVAGAINHANYRSELFKDAHLTELGYRQAHSLSRHIQATGLKVDLVVCSLMSRALETAVVAFGNHDVATASHHDETSKPLMVQRTAEDGISTAHPAVSAEGGPPFLAVELCREHLGVHPCDARRPLSFYKKTFPAIDFSLVQHEQDPLWQADYRELDEEVSTRGVRFLQWIMTRPERTIAVVTHCGFLRHTLRSFAHNAAPDVRDSLHLLFQNAEMRSVVIFDSHVEPAADPLFFPGGEKAL